MKEETGSRVVMFFDSFDKTEVIIWLKFFDLEKILNLEY